MHFSNAARCALESLWKGESRDEVSRFGRYALSFCAAAMLAGCGGGSGAPLSPSPAGVTAERTHVRHAYDVLHRFKGAPGDGYIPVGGLLNLKDTLYGTTFFGVQTSSEPSSRSQRPVRKLCSIASKVARETAKTRRRPSLTSRARSTARLKRGRKQRRNRLQDHGVRCGNSALQLQRRLGGRRNPSGGPP